MDVQTTVTRLLWYWRKLKNRKILCSLVSELISGALFWRDIRDNDIHRKWKSHWMIQHVFHVVSSELTQLGLWEGVRVLTLIHLLQYLCLPSALRRPPEEALVFLFSLCPAESVTDQILSSQGWNVLNDCLVDTYIYFFSCSNFLALFPCRYEWVWNIVITSSDCLKCLLKTLIHIV